MSKNILCPECGLHDVEIEVDNPMSNSTQNDWDKEIQFNLENLIIDIGTQVTDDYKDKNGLYEGMSIKNVRSRDKYKKIFSKLLADARKEGVEKIEKGFVRYRSDKYKTDSLALSYKKWILLKNSIIKDEHI